MLVVAAAVATVAGACVRGDGILEDGDKRCRDNAADYYLNGREYACDYLVDDDSENEDEEEDGGGGCGDLLEMRNPIEPAGG